MWLFGNAHVQSFVYKFIFSMFLRPDRILLDTDFGTDVDDALALALALISPEINLVAVVTVGRCTSYNNKSNFLRQSYFRKTLVEGYLKLFVELPKNIPVYPGEVLKIKYITLN